MPRLRVALLRPGNIRINGLRDQPLSTRSSDPRHTVRMGMHSGAVSKGSDVVRPAWPLHDYLQQVEKYDNDSSSVFIEEGVGDEDEDEDVDSARLVSAQYARAVADVPRTDVLSALMLHLCPPSCLLRVCLSKDGARQLLGFGRGPIQHFDARFAVVH